MPGVRNVGEYVDSMLNGKILTSSFRKVASQASVADWWVDLSMASGNPVPNYYASDPLVAAKLLPFRGIFHGDNKSPSKKIIVNASLCTSNTNMVGHYKLLDYLLYYPFIDLDSTDDQVMDNTITLDRYIDGNGVMAMLVTVAPTVGGGTFNYTFVDHLGTTKVSPDISLSVASAGIGSITTSEPGTACIGTFFLPMASGSEGIRRILQFNVVLPNGGLGCLVLVKPLTDLTIREVNMENELEYISMKHGNPQIFDNAYLNLIMRCAGSVASAPVTGKLTTSWN